MTFLTIRRAICVSGACGQTQCCYSMDNGPKKAPSRLMYIVY